jgi:hypothetical protein
MVYEAFLVNPWIQPSPRKPGSSIVQNNRQQRIIDFDPAVVLDETEFPEFVHEKIHARTRGPDHFRKRFLGNVWEQSVRMLSLPVASEQEQRARKALLARIEELIDQIFFHANIVRQHVPDEMVG